MPTSTNRTKWPLKGGAVSIQPGWFPGHQYAQFYINMGYGTEPLNYSHAMLGVFSITGPSNTQYDGTFCMPQVPLPNGYEPKVGDNATIQVIELAQHGASLYNVSSNTVRKRVERGVEEGNADNLIKCADITFAEPGDPEIPQVNQTNCFNSSQPHDKIGFQMLYTSSMSMAPQGVAMNFWTSILGPLLLACAMWATWL